MHEYKIDVLRVVDGDTVDVDIDLGFSTWLKKQRIRLYGIDTPESRTRDLEEKKYGKMAGNFLEDAIKDAEVVSLRTYKDAKGKYGRILNVSSIGVKYGGGKNTFNYSFSKHALEFIPSKIKSLTNLNILSNILRVGVVNTKMMKKIKNKNIAKRISLIPIKRAAKRTEIAETIYFLSSDKNTYISNEKITIAGGE